MDESGCEGMDARWIVIHVKPGHAEDWMLDSQYPDKGSEEYRGAFERWTGQMELEVRALHLIVDEY
jgi:hypothetical protein